MYVCVYVYVRIVNDVCSALLTLYLLRESSPKCTWHRFSQVCELAAAIFFYQLAYILLFADEEERGKRKERRKRKRRKKEEARSKK